jgi:hypothetical protein
MGKITMTDILRVMRNSGRLFQQPPQCEGAAGVEGGEATGNNERSERVESPVGLFLHEARMIHNRGICRSRQTIFTLMKP